MIYSLYIFKRKKTTVWKIELTYFTCSLASGFIKNHRQGSFESFLIVSCCPARFLKSGSILYKNCVKFSLKTLSIIHNHFQEYYQVFGEKISDNLEKNWTKFKKALKITRKKYKNLLKTSLSVIFNEHWC